MVKHVDDVATITDWIVSGSRAGKYDLYAIGIQEMPKKLAANSMLSTLVWPIAHF